MSVSNVSSSKLLVDGYCKKIINNTYIIAINLIQLVVLYYFDPIDKINEKKSLKNDKKNWHLILQNKKKIIKQSCKNKPDLSNGLV